jgi:hypothetical protein
MRYDFEIISEITDVKTIAVGKRIREIARLQRPMEEVNGANSKVLHGSDFPMVQLDASSFIGTRLTALGRNSR